MTVHATEFDLFSVKIDDFILNLYCPKTNMIYDHFLLCGEDYRI